MSTMTIESALELGYRAGFIAACNWPAPISQDVDSPAFAADVCYFVARHTPLAPPPAQAASIDSLAQEIRRVDGNHSLGAGALAEALMPFITAHMPR